jgi:hypothetical protein
MEKQQGKVTHAWHPSNCGKGKIGGFQNRLVLTKWETLSPN